MGVPPLYGVVVLSMLNLNKGGGGARCWFKDCSLRTLCRAVKQDALLLTVIIHPHVN